MVLFISFSVCTNYHSFYVLVTPLSACSKLKNYYSFAPSHAQPKDELISELGLLSIGKKNIFRDNKKC